MNNPAIQEKRSGIGVKNLTPDRVLDIGYCAHVCHEVGEESTRFPLAKLVLDNFQEVCEKVTFDTPEWWFISSISGIIVSLSKGITRRKRDLKKNLARIEEERVQRIQKITQATRSVGFLKAAARTILFGGLGFLVMRTFVPWIDFEKPVQPNVVSLAVAIGTVIVVSFVRSWIVSAQFHGIFHLHDQMLMLAEKEYRRGALEEYKRAKSDARQAWKRYTGEEAVDWPGYEAVLQEEEEQSNEYANEKAELLAHPVLALVHRLIEWRQKRRASRTTV